MIFIAAKNDFPWSWPKEIFCSPRVPEVRFPSSASARVTHTYKPSVRQIVGTWGGLFQFGAIKRRWREESPSEEAPEVLTCFEGPWVCSPLGSWVTSFPNLKGSFWRLWGLWSLAAWRKELTLRESPCACHVSVHPRESWGCSWVGFPAREVCALPTGNGMPSSPVGQWPSHKVNSFKPESWPNSLPHKDLDPTLGFCSKIILKKFKLGSFVSTTSDTCQNTLQELFQSFSLNICRKLLIHTKMHLHITSLASRRSPSELGGQVSVSISQGNWQPEKCRAHTARERWRNQTSCGSRRVCMFTVERYWGLPLGTPKGLKAPATYLMRSAINFLIWKRRSWLWITLYLYFLKGKREREKKKEDDQD